MATLVVREEDVRTVRKEQESFGIEVGLDTHVLVRIEQVRKASELFPGKAGCANCQERGSITARRPILDWDLDNATICSITRLCVTILGKELCHEFKHDCRPLREA